MVQSQSDLVRTFKKRSPFFAGNSQVSTHGISQPRAGALQQVSSQGKTMRHGVQNSSDLNYSELFTLLDKGLVLSHNTSHR